MLKHKSLQFLFPAILSIVVAVSGFNCNILGPHRSSSPDTTSSNFTWTVDTIGASGSYLYDVSIVNDTLAYAVGALGTDSTGLFNAAVWNGTIWTMIKVPYYFSGGVDYPRLTSVFAFSPNDIWFGTGNMEHWNGSQYVSIQTTGAFNGTINKIWGTSDNNLYIVGTSGQIAHLDAQGWHSVETGTTLPFQDIWGDGEQVLAVASDKFGLGGKYLVQLNGNTAVHLDDSIPTAVSLSGIWFVPNRKYFLVGDGVLTKDSLSKRTWQYDYSRSAASYYSFAIRGDGINNIAIAGGYGDVSFYNGAGWTENKQLYNPIDQMRSVSLKGNTIIAVGIRTYSGLKYYGVIYTGRR